MLKVKNSLNQTPKILPYIIIQHYHPILIPTPKQHDKIHQIVIKHLYTYICIRGNADKKEKKENQCMGFFKKKLNSK